MKKVLSFDKPKKVLTTEKHNEKYQSDSGVAGTYVPNMSEKDMKTWRGKHIKGDDERVEIRKTIEGTQLLIVVYKNPNPVKYNYNKLEEWRKRHQDIRMSMNGKLDMTEDEYWEMTEAINEAIEILL